MKKVLAVLLVLWMCLGSAAMAEETTYRIGICQLVRHVALDAATQGFQDALTEKLGNHVVFDLKNASGDSNTCSTIVNGFVSDGVDLIMANATPALQAAVAATGDLPILIMPPHWILTTGWAPPASTYPAPATWRPWNSRRRCSMSCSQTPKKSAFCFARPSPIPNTRRTRSPNI